MGKDEEHTHNHRVTEVLNPLGPASGSNRIIYAVEDHYFCNCGDFYTVPKGTREQ